MLKNLKIENIYKIASIIIFVIGLFFTYLITKIEDAPGFIILGTAITTGSCLFLFGLGRLIGAIEANNKMLADILKK